MAAAVLPADERDRMRTQVIAAAPRWYSPRGHLVVTSLLGIVPIVVGIAIVRDVATWQLGAATAFFVLCCHVEWWAHRHVLHHRRRLLGVLFDEHTPEHHGIFVTDDMALRGLSEARLVLIPSSGIVAILALISPIPIALYVAGQPNLAGLFAAVSAGYVLAYEWIHLAAHMPTTWSLASTPPIRFLRRHHAIHHHPGRMQRCNFNVVCPLADAVRGSLVTRISE